MTNPKALKEAWQREVLGPFEAKNSPRTRAPLLAGQTDAAPLYGPDDVARVDFERDVGFPGKPPFTRGIQPNMYRGRLWTMRQYAGFGTARESNERYRYLLSQGQTGLSVAFDLPTQMGRDSDDPHARGEVGRVGVAIDSIDDMRTLLAGIPLDKVSTSMTINATAAILLASTSPSPRRAASRARKAPRHDPERHPQGVHGARDVHLPAAPVASAHHRHLRVLPA